MKHTHSLLVLRTLMLPMALLFSGSVFAITKCETNGVISYSDSPCTGGKILKVDENNRVALQASTDSQARYAQDKSELKRLEKARHRREAIEEREQRQANRRARIKQEKCKALALRVKWQNEDARSASGKSAEKTKRKARRLAEQYEYECGRR